MRREPENRLSRSGLGEIRSRPKSWDRWSIACTDFSCYCWSVTKLLFDIYIVGSVHLHTIYFSSVTPLLDDGLMMWGSGRGGGSSYRKALSTRYLCAVSTWCLHLDYISTYRVVVYTAAVQRGLVFLWGQSPWLVLVYIQTPYHAVRGNELLELDSLLVHTLDQQRITRARERVATKGRNDVVSATLQNRQNLDGRDHSRRGVSGRSVLVARPLSSSEITE